MRELVRGLLAYARVRHDARELEEIDCDLVLREALTDLRETVAASGGQVTQDRLPTIMADSIQIEQVFQNLIGNALKFHSDKPPEVHIGADRQNGEWRFRVSDNGLGIEPQYADKIFVVFQRLHKRRDYPGTGVGLAICKKIVERHRGKIWFESEPGKGSTFYFSIPILKGGEN